MLKGTIRDHLFDAPGRALAVLMCAALASPAQAEPLDLLAAYEQATRNDPRILAARDTLAAERTRIPQARSLLLPNISASGESVRVDSEVITDAGILSRPAGRARYDSDSYSFVVRQPLFQGAAIAGLRQSRAEVRRAESEYVAAALELMTRVSEAYFAALAADDALALAQAEREALARQLESSEQRLEVGLATRIDVHDARARAALAEAEVISATNLVRDRREALAEITGRPPGTLLRLKPELPAKPPEPNDPVRWVETALAQNATLAARQAAADAAREEMRRQGAEHLPSLDLVGSHNRTDTDGSITGPGVRNNDQRVGFELSVPIFEGGLVVARTREARHRYSAAQRLYEAERRAVERSVLAAFNDVSSAAARIDALRQATVAADAALEAKREGFAAGVNTNIDVLDATRDLFRARRDYAQARYDYVLNLLRLRRAAGTLTDADLAGANAWLAREGA